MKPVDPNSAAPYYSQVIDALRDKIQKGAWRPGDQLPSEAEMCAGFQVSRTVIRQALDELTYEGLVLRRKGRGAFVASPKVKEGLVQRLTGFYQDMVRQGYVPVTQVLKQHVVEADHKVADRLALAPKTSVFEIERLRFLDDEPILIVTTYIPYKLCPDLLQEDLASQSLYQLLEEKYGLSIARGYRTIEAVQANETEASLLQVDLKAPLVLIRSTSYLADDTPLEYYHAVHRGDRSRFEVELLRSREQGNLRQMLNRDSDSVPPSHHVKSE